MRSSLGVAVAVIVLLGCSSSNESGRNDGSNWSVSPTPTTTITLGELRSGEATYYDFANGDGACMFGPSPEDLNVAALNSPDYANAAWCGACADVTGPSGKVRVRIVDRCPECPSGNLDLSPQAFSQIAALNLGRVPITWAFVACDVRGPVKYRYKDGASQWWTAVQVANHRFPITSFEWSSDGVTFKEIPRTNYNFFLEEAGFGASPVKVRITASNGQSLLDNLPSVQEYLVVDGHAQFE